MISLNTWQKYYYAVLGPQKIQEVQSYASQPPLLILEKLGLGLGAAPDTATQFFFQYVMSLVLLRACLHVCIKSKKDIGSKKR